MFLQVQNLTYAYHNLPVLHNVSLCAEDGQLVCLVGPNGAGKSTLLKCILGIYHHWQGDVLLNNQSIKKWTAPQLAQKMAYIPQAGNFSFNYNVLDVVLMGRTAQLNPFSGPDKTDEAIAFTALRQLGIENFSLRGFQTLSGGEKQLVLIARALTQKTNILILDEPTANLDFSNQWLVMDKINTLAKQGYLILLSTHTPEHALLYSHQTIALQKGKLLFSGITQEVLTEESLSALYGMPVLLTSVQKENRVVPVCLPKNLLY